MSDMGHSAEKDAGLRAVAEAADNGGRPWEWTGGYPQQVVRVGDAMLVAETYEGPDFPSTIAEFIATFDPPTVLTLLDELRANRRVARDAVSAEVRSVCTCGPREEVRLHGVAVGCPAHDREGDEDYLDVVFDGPPSHQSGRFVEVENADGESVNAGEWIDRGNGLWALRIRPLPPTEGDA